MTSSGVTLRYKVFYIQNSVKIARESCMLCLIFPENFAGIFYPKSQRDLSLYIYMFSLHLHSFHFSFIEITYPHKGCM